jgi:putative nucleotidyltransferase with HDIG domain
METLSIVCNDVDRFAFLSRELVGMFAVRLIALDDIAHQEPDASSFVDVDLGNITDADQLRVWLGRRSRQSAAIFAVDRCSRIQTVRAYSIGASDIAYRPVSRGALLGKLMASRAHAQGSGRARGLDASCGVIAGIDALQQLFTFAINGAPLDVKVIEQAGETLVKHIEAFGLGDWIQAIRVHHDQTYQHCLLVSGVAAAFAKRLGFSAADRRRVAMAGLLHDTGKVMTPVAILEAPRRLFGDEMEIVKRHPEFGHRALQPVDGLHPEMLDMVLHHHEFLDGSGYPDRLGAGDISDLTRVTTIADIFGALVERRAYRPPMSGRAAYEILLSMNGKLDHHLVRAFEPLSHLEVLSDP